MLFKGRVYRFGDNIDTDGILPGRYLSMDDPALLAPHCMEDADPGFAGSVRKGDIIVGGRNFGCGSSREHAAIAIKASGVSCVVAKSFARIFFRNCINIGLPVVVCPEAAEAVQGGEAMEIDTERGSVAVKDQVFSADPFPPFVTEIIEAGGLVGFTKQGKGAV